MLSKKHFVCNMKPALILTRTEKNLVKVFQEITHITPEIQEMNVSTENFELKSLTDLNQRGTKKNIQKWPVYFFRQYGK